MAAIKRLAFPVEEYHTRVHRVQEEMRQHGLDALLIHTLANICYLTGLESIAPHKYWLSLVPASGDPALLAQDFESGNILLGSWIENYVTYPVGGDPVEATRKLLLEYGLADKRLGIETTFLSSLSVGDWERLKEVLLKATWVDASELVPRTRAVKSTREIECIRQAAGISSTAMRAAIEAVAEGTSDNDIAAAAYDVMIRGGSEYPSYAPIVTTGARSGIPHSTFQRVPIRKGDPVFMELGACIRRYHAPIMRTAVVGEPGEEIRRMAQACIESVNTMAATIKPGMVAGEVALAAKKALAGLPEDLVWHGYYGYSVGLGFPPEWGDCDSLNIMEGSTDILRPGMVFHASTSLRALGEYGTTCSETILVTEDGCEALTQVSRGLFIK